MLNFILFAFITSITPGPNNSLLMASGLRFGVKRTLPHLLGINCGFGLMFLTIGSILPLLPAQTLDILRWIAFALLAYIAFKIATASSDIKKAEEHEAPWGFFKAAAFQWINPKALLMAFAGATAYGLDTLSGAIIFSLVNSVCIVWIFAGAGLHRFLINNPLRTRILYIFLAISMVASLII